MPIKLDVRDFKHVSSDENTTTLRHKKGHEIRIAHKSLSKDAKAQLDQLAKSSQTPEQSRESHRSGTVYTDSTSKGVEQANEIKRQGGGKYGSTIVKMAKGGKVDKDDVKIYHKYDLPGNVNLPKQHTEPQEAEDEAGENHRLLGAEDVHYAVKGKKVIGHVAQDDEGKVKGVYVDPEHRRKGVAEKLYHHVANTSGEIKSDSLDAQEPGAKAMWNKLSKKHPDRVSKSKEGYTLKGENKKKMAEGGEPRQMFAEGGKAAEELPQMPPEMAASTPIQDLTQPIQTPVDPQQQHMQQMYNSFVSMKPAYVDTANLQVHNPSEKMFSPTGEAPQQLDPRAAEMTLKTAAHQEQQKQAALGAEVLKQAKDQQLLSQFGVQGPTPLPPIQRDVQGQVVIPPSEQVATSPGLTPSGSPQMPQGMVTPQQLNDDPEAMIKSGYDRQMQGITDMAKAEGDLGRIQAQKMQETIKAREAAQDTYKQQFSELEAERKAAIRDIQEGHISPERYWTGDPKTGEGGHSKIMTGIGIILAGFNPTNNPNAAINFLKHQMDMNLQAQAKNLDSKQNLLAHNLRQFGNIKDASDMTRVMQNDLLAHQLNQAAATAKSPMAAAAAQQAAGKLTMESASMFQQFAMRRAMMNLAGQPGGNPQATEQMIAYMRAVNPEMAKSMEQRYVPGVGLGSIPIPDSARQEIIAHDKLQAAAKDLEAFTKSHTTIVPGTPEYNVGAQKALVMQQALRESMLGGVFKESEKPLLEKLVNDNPAGMFKSFSTLPKLKELMRTNEVQGNILKQSYGLPVQHTSIANEVKIGKDGKSYVLDPSGKYYVPVKGSK